MYEQPWISHQGSIFAVVIENGVTSIGKWSFACCYNLTSITIPNSVTSIREDAFFYCRCVKSVIIPESVDSIGNGAFYACSIKTMNIPHSVTYLGHLFCNNSVLTSIQVDDNNEIFSSENGVLFNKTKIVLIKYPAGKKDKDYSIPNSVKSIGKHAFFDCRGLKSVTIGDSVITIEETAFFECHALMSASIGKSVEIIGSNAFSGCNRLSSVTIPNSTTHIDIYAFSRCSGLKSITIGNSVTSIGYGAFWDCIGLTSVIIPNSVTTIGDMAFKGCHGLLSVSIPNSVTSMGGWAFKECHGLKSIHVDEDNIAYSSENGVLFNKAKTRLIQYPVAKPDRRYTIPNSVEHLEWGAFYSCNHLLSLTIPSSVIDFGEGIFDGCSSLKEIINYAKRPRFSANQFNKVNKSKCVLRVPADAVEIYRGSETWRDFAIIETIK